MQEYNILKFDEYTGYNICPRCATWPKNYVPFRLCSPKCEPLPDLDFPFELEAQIEENQQSACQYFYQEDNTHVGAAEMDGQMFGERKGCKRKSSGMGLKSQKITIATLLSQSKVKDTKVRKRQKLTEQ